MAHGPTLETGLEKDFTYTCTYTGAHELSLDLENFLVDFALKLEFFLAEFLVLSFLSGSPLIH